jgi:peptide/nickel transport system ATP-binding protein
MSHLELRDVTVRFGIGRRSVIAVDRVNLELSSGQVVGLIGESGSGKSSLARAVVGLAPISSGDVLLDGIPVTKLRSGNGRRRLVQLVFQDPSAALDPRMTVGDSIAEGIRGGEEPRPPRFGGRASRRSRVVELLDQVGLDPRLADSRPAELSGGQRQRATLARALAARPEILVADEITSALDVSVQGAVLNLVRDLQRHLGFSLLFITHNLAVVRYVADTIGVMHRGHLVEIAETARLVAQPAHPHTRSLLTAVPRLGGRPLPPTGQ